MSIFGEFQQVWHAKFPQSALPSAWEQDVRANLDTHKQKVANLKLELEKETVYVQYLETLLAEFETHSAKLKQFVQENREPVETEIGSTAADLSSKESPVLPYPAPSAPPRESPLSETAATTKCASDLSDYISRDALLGASASLVTKSTTATDISASSTSIAERPAAPDPTHRYSSISDCSSVLSGLSTTAAVPTTPVTDLDIALLLPSPGGSTMGSEAGTPVLLDNSPFVTVIAVNGSNNVSKVVEAPAVSSSSSTFAVGTPPTSTSTGIGGGLSNTSSPSSTIKVPPLLPKPKLKKFGSQDSPNRSGSLDSNLSSSEHEHLHLSPVEEPYYDLVPVEDDKFAKSEGSSTENVFTSSSTLPMGSINAAKQRDSLEPQSPEHNSNYVNIEYFIIKQKSAPDSDGDDDEDDEIGAAKLSKNTNNGSYASSSSLESSTPATRRKYYYADTDAGKSDEDRSAMYKSILLNIIESEKNYVEWLSVLISYMKAIKASLGTSQPPVTEADYKIIFYKIPDLHELHSKFLDSLKRHSKRWDSKVGDSFKNMATNLELYGSFLSNYGRAVDTANRCSMSNLVFAQISKSIVCKQLPGQPVSLVELLHKPVARMQKNALVLHDLLKFTPPSHSDHQSLRDALDITQKFLDQFNMIQTKSMFPTNDRAQRRLVKNSFIVEYVDNTRKLRHLFLFNDVMACAKYKSSGKIDKYTFELKWFIPVHEILILEEAIANPHEVPLTNIVSLKSQASITRDLIHEDRIADDKKSKPSRGTEKSRKRLLEIESQLVLVSPNLRFRIKSKQLQNKSVYEFFLSSEFERMQWTEAIQNLQQAGQPPPSSMNNYNMIELQTWITACRAHLKTNMGSYLLRSGHDEKLLIGDLQITIHDLQGLQEDLTGLYIVIEVDFYGHFFQKARTRVLTGGRLATWNETFIIDLEGCENLRLLVYRKPLDAESPVAANGISAGKGLPTLFGKHTLQLSRQWLNNGRLVERHLRVNVCELHVDLKYIANQGTLHRVPSGKVGSLFSEKIQVVCKRQKRDVPFIVSACIREVERRGMSEVGIYRVSSSASDLAQLKKSFETNSYEAEQLLKEVDIHSVTGILKQYFRELPEPLFTDLLYPQLLEIFNQLSSNSARRTEELVACFQRLPKENKATIECILEHLIKVYQNEQANKMSLQNLATVWGPTLLRVARTDNKHRMSLLANETVDAMAQANILLCYLQDKKARLD